MSFYLRILGFTSIFYTCGMVYLAIFVDNLFIRSFISTMSVMLTFRLLLIQVTSTKVTTINNKMYIIFTRVQARANLARSIKLTLLKIIQQIGFRNKPSLALEGSADGSAFVSLSIYSYIEKLVLFFLPLVTFMVGKSGQFGS